VQFAGDTKYVICIGDSKLPFLNITVFRTS